MSDKRVKADWGVARITGTNQVIVCAKHKDEYILKTYDNTDEFRQAISTKEIFIRKWAISVEDQFCIKKSVDLPAQSIEEAAQMLEFELPSLVPISTDEIIYGCTALNQSENLLEIKVYILQKTLLQQKLEPYHAIGVYPEKVVLDSVALHCALRNSAAPNAIFICPDENKCHYLATLNGHIQDYDCLTSLNLNEIIRKETELRAYCDNIDINVANVSGIQLEAFTQSLKEMGMLHPINVLQLPESLSKIPLPLFYETAFAIGTFNSIEEKQFKYLNLLPLEQLAIIKSKSKKKVFISQIGIYVAIFLLIWANFSVWNWRTNRACQKVQELINPIKDRANDIEQKKLIVRAVQGQVSNRHQILVLFDDLYRFTPESITISELKYHKKAGERYLSIKGQADTITNALSLSAAMKEAELLKEMQVNNAQQVPSPGGSIGQYTAECFLGD